MTKHKHYYAIRAYADGWKIEYLASSNNKWYPSEYPEFAKNLAYRVVPDENGWLPWYGGECPVDPGTVVETRVGYRVGKSRKAGDYIWGSSITAYRVIEEKAVITDLTVKLAESQAREAKLRDFAQWLTGCCDLTQYDYFIQNRHILAEQPDATALKEFKRKVLLEAAEFASTQGDIDFVVWQLRRMAEE